MPDDTARFRITDPDTLVLASLACPYCLHADEVRWDPALEGHDPWVRCECPTCEQHWRVYLTAQQSLRLGLMALRMPHR